MRFEHENHMPIKSIMPVSFRRGRKLKREEDHDLDSRNRKGLLDGFTLRAKLILRLMRDSRVHPLLKLLPIGSLLYFIIPDFLPGPIDDAFLFWLGTSMFVELCPVNVVQEHMDDLTQVVDGEWHDLDE